MASSETQICFSQPRMPPLTGKSQLTQTAKMSPNVPKCARMCPPNQNCKTNPLSGPSPSEAGFRELAPRQAAAHSNTRQCPPGRSPLARVHQALLDEVRDDMDDDDDGMDDDSPSTPKEGRAMKRTFTLAGIDPGRSRVTILDCGFWILN